MALFDQLKALREKRAAAVKQGREYLERAEAEKRDMSAEEKASWDKAHGEADSLTKQIEVLERQIEAERKLDGGIVAEPGQRVQDDPKAREKRELEIFGRWIRSAVDGPLSAEDRKELRAWTSATSSPYAGYTIPSSMAATLEEEMKAFGGVLQVSNVLNTPTGETFTMPTSTDVANGATILAEGSQNTGNTHGTFGRLQIASYMLVTDIITLSWQLMRDSNFDLTGLLRRQLAERLARGLNTYLTTGNGSTAHNGVVTAATAGVTAASQTAITADEIIDLAHSVDPAYRPNGRYMFNDTTLKAIRKLKDGNGQYLWAPGMTGGIPGTIFSYPYTINQDMASAAHSAVPMLFGDFSKYIVRLVGQVGLVQFNEKYADYLETAFMGYQASDADLLDAGSHPLRKLTMA